MNDDIRLQALFDSFQPTPTDSDLFTERLERKLALIDEIRQAQAAQIRRYRMVVVAAFVAGIVFGGGVLTFILSTPIDVPLFSFGIKFYPFLFIEQNSRLISVLLTSPMITFCIVAMMNTQDLVRRMKPKNKYI